MVSFFFVILLLFCTVSNIFLLANYEKNESYQAFTQRTLSTATIYEIGEKIQFDGLLSNLKNKIPYSNGTFFLESNRDYKVTLQLQIVQTRRARATFGIYDSALNQILENNILVSVIDARSRSLSSNLGTVSIIFNSDVLKDNSFYIGMTDSASQFENNETEVALIPLALSIRSSILVQTL